MTCFTLFIIAITLYAGIYSFSNACNRVFYHFVFSSGIEELEDISLDVWDYL